MVTRMDIPISFDNAVGIVIIAMLIGLFVWMYHRRLRPEATVEAKEELRFAYEWVATPVSKAKKDLLDRFPELTDAVDAETRDGLTLVRFGLFNMTKEIVTKDQFKHPIKIRFPADTMILSARFGEALKMERKSTAEPVVNESIVLIPAESMNPRSTLIYNLILRGNAAPDSVTGEIEGKGHIERVH